MGVSSCVVDKKELAGRLYKAVGSRIAQVRRAAEPALTQERLAGLSQLSRSAIANIERGRQRLALHHLYLIAQALGVEPAALLPPTVDVAAFAQLQNLKEREWFAKIARKPVPGSEEQGDAETTTD